MKIIVISSEFPPLTGGAGSYIYDFTKQLAKICNKVTVVTRQFDHSDLHLKSENLEIIFVKNIKKIFIFLLWKSFLKEYTKKTKYDLIILNDVGAAITASLFFNEEMIKKTVYIFHGQENSKIIEKKQTIIDRILKIRKKYFNLIETCKLLIAVSEFQKEKIIRYIEPKILINHKFHVVYNGFDPDIFFPVENLRKNTSFNITTVSRILKKKGFDIVLKIMEVLHELNINFIWNIIGNGLYENKFRTKVRMSKVKTKVIFHGRKKREELRDHYSSSDLFILLSEFEESFGLVYLEAIACGCPVIGFDSGGVKEVVENGINGYLIKPGGGDEIISASVEKILMIRKSSNFKNISSTVTKFKIENNAKKFLEILQRRTN